MSEHIYDGFILSRIPGELHSQAAGELYEHFMEVQGMTDAFPKTFTYRWEVLGTDNQRYWREVEIGPAECFDVMLSYFGVNIYKPYP